MTTENQGPQKFEARAKTGAAEQERVKARQRSRDYEAAYGFSLCRSIDLRPRPHFGLLIRSLRNLNAPHNPIPLSAQHRQDFVRIHRTTLTRAK